MARPWPVDFLNNAVITIDNHMNSWTRLSFGTFMVTLQFVLNLVKTPAVLLNFFTFLGLLLLFLISVCFFFLLWG